ncbi:MAG: ribose 5-phosphate isomerase B [Alphaproteobacteria bacterium]|nr:ribose 5-phosphate isomerase B [Alphaproteobacteria bacterium]MBQ8784808.1 ribose 5-phosphate isomerase B [Alphaproteobacteria bacterium]
MNIAIASDHGGFELKQQLIEHFAAKGQILEDLGTCSTDSCDYPDIAKKMAKNILNHQNELGILICGTGIGISIAANRFKGIRAAVLYDDFTAEMTKKHNNANVLVFGGRTMKFEDVIRRIEIFNNTEFEGGRHATRIAKIEEGVE